MTDFRKDLPPMTSPVFMSKVQEAISTYLGNRGDVMDRGITVRDLSEAGMVTLFPGYTNGLGGGKTPIKGPGPKIINDEVDLTPPPTPTGFVLGAAISNVSVQHDATTYLQGHGHAKTKVYGITYTTGSLPVFTDAIKITEFTGNIFSYATNPATTWRMWITWVTVDGVESLVPAGGTNGLAITTGQDVALLLTALTGQIKESQLFSSLGNRINLIDGPIGLSNSVSARILEESLTRVGADASLASSIATLSANVNTNNTALSAAIQTEATARASAVEAVATSVTTLQASVGSNTAAIQTEATARTSADNTLYAQYTVKIDVNNYVSGYGLASTSAGGVPASAFAVRADSFFIASPNGPGIAPTVPFIVRTTPAVINGVTVPAGVYLTDGYIQNGTITNAKIGDAAIDDAKIGSVSANKITAGAISVGRYIQSANFVTGVSGWRIDGSGTAEFGLVSVRGNVSASSGDIGGSTITANAMYSSNYVYGNLGWLLRSDGTGQMGGVIMDSNAIRSNNYVADSAGWRLHQSGALEANSGKFRGAISASSFRTGDFTTYNWPAAGGSGVYLDGNGLLLGNYNDGKYFQVQYNGNIFAPGFSVVNGNLTINQVNVIDTLNIAGNAVTLPSISTGFGVATVSASFVAGQSVFVMGSSDGFVLSTSGTPILGTTSAVLRVNGVALKQLDAPNSVQYISTADNTTPNTYAAAMALVHSFVPSYTGAHTLTLTRTDGANTLFVMQVKR